jgi:hypothetical protein
VENTALGHWWSKDRVEMFKWTEANKEFAGKGLCSECMPQEFSDGSGKVGNGKWHKKFPKQKADDFLKDNSGNYKLRQDGYLEYFE